MTKGKKSHGVSIEGEFHIKANNVIVNGSSRETYDPFPEEENNYSSASFKIVQKDLLAGHSEKQTGWIKGADGTWQYFYSNGKMATGWMKDGNTWYYFDPSSGTMATNSWKQDSKGDWYYLGSDGKMVINRWEQDSKGDWYYLGSDGKMVTDTWEQDSKGNWYHLNADGKMEGSDDSNLKSDYNSIELLSRAMPKAANVEDSSEKDCKLLVGASIGAPGYDAIHYPGSVLGLNQGDGIIPEKKYIIDPSMPRVGFADDDIKVGWEEEGDGWYYYYLGGGKAEGWLKDNGNWYYLDDDGKMQTGWLQDNDNWYYLNSNGAMETGWLKYNGSWYYLNSSGAMATGWTQDGGEYYYLYPDNGSMAWGRTIRENSDSNLYYVGYDGMRRTNKGWKEGTDKDNNVVYYYVGSNKTAVTGWNSIENKWYYFDED